MIFEKVMTAVPQDEASSQSPGIGASGPGDMPVLPIQSQEDTDADWGERPGPEEDERLHRERPPHWAV
jgi:hypothetical protein